MNPLKYAEQIAYSSKEVLHFSYAVGHKYKYSKGCYVETGVGAGAQLIALAFGSGLGGGEKKIYGFDSFEGIPKPSNKDDQMPGIRTLTLDEQLALPDPGIQVLESTGATSIGIEWVKHHLVSAGVASKNITLVKGWFEETMPDAAYYLPDISVLRLDGDLYNSTYVVLKYLYPRVIEGGMVLIDDYALKGCRDAVHDYIIEQDLHFTPQFLEGKESTLYYWTK